MTPRYTIESLSEFSPAVLWASFFMNPAIALMESYGRKPFPCAVTCENIDAPLVTMPTCNVEVEFDWLPDTFPGSQRLFQTLQREAIVEYAAVAAAFLLMSNLVQQNIAEVTLRGSKTDYFVAGRKHLLEISGTESAKRLNERHNEKVGQLRANPFGKDGYVFVCCFSNQQARLSFHQVTGTNNAEEL